VGNQRANNMKLRVMEWRTRVDILERKIKGKGSKKGGLRGLKKGK